MNVIMIVLLILAIIVVFLLFLAMVTPGAYTIHRDIVINRPSAEVFNYVKLIKNQEQYSHWVMQDPTNKIIYVGTDGTVGFLSRWEGQGAAGKGEQEIISIAEGNHIQLELRFEKPFKNTAITDMVTKNVSNHQTEVTWKMQGRNKFPMTLFNLVIDHVLGKDLSKSLANFKDILEKQ